MGSGSWKWINGLYGPFFFLKFQFKELLGSIGKFDYHAPIYVSVS